jgi:hypothetical protein
MSGLFARPSEITRESTGSLKRLHQRERSFDGEVEGKPAAFLQFAGRSGFGFDGAGPREQAVNVIVTRLADVMRRASFMKNSGGRPVPPPGNRRCESARVFIP